MDIGTIISTIMKKCTTDLTTGKLKKTFSQLRLVYPENTFFSPIDKELTISVGLNLVQVFWILLQSSWVNISVPPLMCPENIVSLVLSTTPGSKILLTPNSMKIRKAWWESYDISILGLRAYQTHVTHNDKLRVPVLMNILEASLMRAGRYTDLQV